MIVKDNMKRMLSAMAITLLSITCVYAGWEHAGGKTYWVNASTTVSCFVRNNTTLSVCPSLAPQVYQDSIKIGTNGNMVSYGLWGVSSDGNYYPLADVGVADYQHRNDPNWRKDVEWEVNSGGNLMLKQ